jgi:ABC-type sugar transport system ATPase subunit
MTRDGVFVELRSIGKRFGGVQALKGIDLEINEGSIHGLVGENGAGKSTLGKIVAGVHRPDKGELWIGGRQVSYHSPRDALADGVTMIAQEPTIVPRRSVIENVFLGIEAGLRGGVLATGAMRRSFESLVQEAGFRLPPDAPVGSLRVADQQKVEILRSVARNARLIVMDEPTAALTADEAKRLFAIVRRLRERGATIVFLSHFLAEVLSLVDSVTVLRDGRLIRTSVAYGESPESLVRAMLGRSIALTFPDKEPPQPEAPVVLTVRGLSRPGVLDGVSLDIRAGEILGLAGLIGSGRSEVARAIFGADSAIADITLEGRPLRVRSPRDAIRAGIAMLPEDRKFQGLLMQRSVVENVSLAHLATVSRAGVVSQGRERDRVGELVRRLDVRAKSPAAKVATLSGGNQQKTLFAKWLFRRPRVLLADEPTRGVDVGAKRGIYELIRGLARQGMAVLFISSEHEEVLGLAHRVLVMREGRIVSELDGEAMSEDAIMRAAFATDRSDTGKARR